MKTQAWYDIIVIGSDLSGLLYAALAAKAGYRVLVVGQNAKTNSYRLSGSPMVRNPELFYGINSSPALKKVFSTLGMSLAMRHRPEVFDPTLHLIYPGARLDLAANSELWANEWEREFLRYSEDLNGWERFCQSATELSNPILNGHIQLAHSRNTEAKRLVGEWGKEMDSSFSQFIRHHTQSFALQEFLEAICAHMGSIADPHPVAAARLFHHLQTGFYHINGGMDELRSILTQKIREQCGDVHLNWHVRELITKRGKVLAIRTGHNGDKIGCELAVINLSPQRAASLLPDENKSERFFRKNYDKTPKYFRFTVNVVCEKNALNPAFGHNAILFDDEHPPVWLHRPHGMAADGGLQTLTLRVLVKPIHATATLALLQNGVTHALNALVRTFPFIDPHISTVDVPAIQVDEYGNEVLDNRYIEEVFHHGLSEHLGLSAMSIDTPYANLLFGGDAVFAGLGLEGQGLSSLMCLKLTKEILKLTNRVTTGYIK